MWNNLKIRSSFKRCSYEEKPGINSGKEENCWNGRVKKCDLNFCLVSFSGQFANLHKGVAKREKEKADKR